MNVDRHCDNNALFRTFRLKDGYLRLRKRPIIKAIFINIALCACGGIDQAVHINKSKFIEMIEPLHARLIGFQMRFVTDVFIGHQFYSNSDRLDLFLQVIRHDLFPAAS